MKLLLLQSSGRTGGNTARILSLTGEALQAEASRAREPLELETIHLAEQDIRPCRGCRSCFDQGEHTCPQRDDMPAIKAKMREADGLVLASPVYINDVNGVMKNWLDRLAHVCHRPEFAGKTALLLSTTGSTSARHTLRSMQVPLWTWGYRTTGALWFKTGAIMSAEDVRQRHFGIVAQASAKLFREILDKRYLRPSFVALMIFRIQQAGWRKVRPDSMDYTYWRDKGWLDTRRTTFFFPHRAGIVTTRLARLVGALAAAITL